ncbi:Phosphoethanolamine N-methyltransferase 3 [Fusarium agapanthi]|uniref:Phosphoethanolamine N-methyltransferase 3 n=1 Tax=Fusarium agapanthi TaxID=1803897 RepID=A0A9P5E7R7_9HYPO|nr:Phosphoethanolamine N-methyltransferase 3 [Fusarium agapanthi]
MSSPRAAQEEVIQPDAALQSVTDDEAYDNESEQSSLTSLTSSILHGKAEGGRTYAVYGKEGKSPREICFAGANKFQNTDYQWTRLSLIASICAMLNTAR